VTRASGTSDSPPLEADGFLARMCRERRERITSGYGSLTKADRERLARAGRPPLDFPSAVIGHPSVAVIAEIKKASPSAGPIAPDREVIGLARAYVEGGASAISVLTEPTAFGGCMADLSDVADAVRLPVLCKDFVVDEVQLFLARGHGADAVLLMVSVLGEQTPDYCCLAESLGLAALVEVHDANELDLARRAGATLVGVNSRDLRDLSIDAEGARGLVAQATGMGLGVVFESGIRSRADVAAAAEAGADAVLVGETLMRSDRPRETLHDLTGVPRSRGRRTDGGGEDRG
jgi:indole-3-glycerol phosphate synthase